MPEGRTHKPVIQPDRCHACNVCIRGCPAELFPEYRGEDKSLRGTLYQEKLKEKPVEQKVHFPPCQEACPIHQDVRGYVSLIAEGNFKEALETIRKINPLPAVCGFICHHPCEEACLREGVDHPIPVRLLKRFVAEYEQKRGKARGRPLKKNRSKVLVIGSGPAGLAASNDLCLFGFEVTIFEALPVLGGMLAVGIPEFRLPRDILKWEIDGIRATGVEMITQHPFHLNGSRKTFQKLGFQATFLSIGAHRSEKLNIPGERLQGVFHGVEFLRDIHLGKHVRIGNRVAVIGGGNVAIDVARSAIRLGAKSVRVYYRRSIKEMPAIPEEVEEAIQEGVKIHFLSSQVKIIERGAEAVGLECVRMRLTEPDQKGRRTPVPIKGSTYQAAADTLLVAVGQRVDRKFITGLDVNPDGTIRVDPKTCETSLMGVFAGGDAVNGGKEVVDAVEDGKKGAAAILKYLKLC